MSVAGILASGVTDSFMPVAPGGQARVDGTLVRVDEGKSSYILSNRVRRDPKRNMRVWMSDGMNDIEVDSNGRQDLYV